MTFVDLLDKHWGDVMILACAFAFLFTCWLVAGDLRKKP